MYNQIHQEQIVAGEITQNTFENPVVQEQVQIVERIQEKLFETTDVLAPAVTYAPDCGADTGKIVETTNVLAPAVTYAAPSQQLPSITKTVTTGVNLDFTGWGNPQFSITGVEVSAPQAVGSFPPLEEFDVPVYNQIHREQIVAGEMNQNTFENPAVQEQVIVQEIPTIVERIQERIVEPIEVLPHERAQQFTAEPVMHMPVPQTQEQSAVTDLVNLSISIAVDEVVDPSEEVVINTISTSTSSSAHVCNHGETTSRGRLDALVSMLDSCCAAHSFGGYG